ncbi:Glucosamine kinase GspK [Tritonibacter multivorans]|uniref:Glucosamine kinase GspK n=1 Tax=Tritonibacter multivorans TaxID=928856 RepID=A0A0P1GHI4_9RHOB|nr:BadF/BadG/BcrA/BcrD ATPase family protein [Tritonibacter multivorans]MDA7420520.1 ATPase [Tritonibacter multivorans]CUH81437.1 Glucosamine kinase GspK [Tritonibacter multivorans]SFC35430.1 glucosamine kinase [Tritonibacter multivorans]
MEENIKPVGKTKVIAVDGGGSRCRMALVGEGLDLRVELGAANATSDFDGALATCREGLAQLASQAGMPQEDLRPLPAYFGLAGICDADQAQRFAAALPLDHARVEEDRAAAVTGALGLDDGAVMHAGTGSFVALRRGNALHCVGGWGPKLGDEGSAHWVGREILRAGLALSDGLWPASTLGQSVLDRFGGASGAITFASEATPGDIAALAPLLLEHSADPQTQDILTRAASYFADTLTTLGWQGEAICPTGGLASHLGAFLPTPMQAALRPAKAAPLEGAILLARRWAEELCP